VVYTSFDGRTQVLKADAPVAAPAVPLKRAERRVERGFKRADLALELVD